MARSRDYKSIRYDSAIDGHCAACSSANLRQASSNRRSMSRGWLAERTGTTRPRRRRRAVRHMPYLPHRTHQLALRARRGSQQERHRLSAGPQRKPSSSFFSRDARQCDHVRRANTLHPPAPRLVCEAMDDLRTDLVSINSVYGHTISGFSYKIVSMPSISLASGRESFSF